MIEQELRGALAAALDGLPARQASGAVERLIAHYRGETPTGAPVLRDAADAAAYAAYRMPATFAAASAALAELAERAGDWTPGSHLDVGGGTGAAVWAAERVWRADRAARTTVVLDWAEPALALGRELASGVEALRGAEWRRGSLRGGGGAAGGGLPEPASADLVTVSYVLGELAEADRHAVVDAAAGAARGAVVLVEPGTPEGYLRIRAARDALLGAGLRVLAPCPHDGACPLVPGQDWCHFAVRVARSSLHRRVKGGELPYEDEKFSYVAAVRETVPGAPAGARIVRRPQLRKGQVLLDLCEDGGAVHRRPVTKRAGADYRAARKAAWGDPW
ncbi:small ribosomal subunit Rsm22 family protein [Streptomyces qinglanensis]|uniref:small ribosomal subunit Rsm22 family protein n=1 Tax=Streptomyces qinglanensis TaxID=943816 RepID=UPI0037BACA40